jgi:hypothetical protein
MIPELRNFPDITLEDIEKLIENRVAEGYYVEYKSEFPGKRNVAKGLASFANTRGGFFIIGLKANDQNEADEVTPISLEGNLTDHINDIRLTIDKPVECDHKVIYTKEGESEGLIIIRVQESPFLPHFYEGRIYVREGERSAPIPLVRYDLINGLFAKRKELEENSELYIGNKVKGYFDNIIKYNEQLPYADRECFLVLTAYPFPLQDGLIPDVFEPAAETKYRFANLHGMARVNDDSLSYTAPKWLEDTDRTPIVPMQEFSISSNGSLFEITHIETDKNAFTRGEEKAKNHGWAGIPTMRIIHKIDEFINKSNNFYKIINYPFTIMMQLFITGVKFKSLLPFNWHDEIYNQYTDNVNLFARSDSYTIRDKSFSINAADLSNKDISEHIFRDFVTRLARFFNIWITERSA